MTAGHGHDRAPSPPGWAQRLGRACGALAALGLLAMTVLTTANLAARWLGLTSPEWVLPLTGEIVAWSMMAGVVTCVASASWLINLDVLRFASRRRQARLEAARHGATAVVFGYLTYVAFTTWWKLFRSGLPSTDIVNLPAWVPASGLVLFFGLAAVVEVGRAWTSYSR